MQNLRRIFIWLTAAVMIFSIVACGKKEKKEEVTEMEKIKLGDVAPDIEAPATNGTNLKLSDLRGSWVVLYFYPKAFTSG